MGVQDDLMLDAHLLEAPNASVLLKISAMGSFTATAAALGVSQPSISQQVKRIERLLDCTLFVRGSLGVKLTSDGEAVVNYAQAMLSLGKNLRLQLAQNAGRLRALTATPTASERPHDAPDPVRSDRILDGISSM